METERICPSCGQALAAGAPQGLCPECLMKAGFGTGAAPEPGEPTHQAPFTPPPLVEMAKLFPQLEVVELLGRGGMGAVYKARQPALDRWVALKVLPPQSTARPGFAERFNREARALARLNHANIVALYEFGEVGGMPYFVMEYVEGVTLRRLAQARRLEPREALKIVPQICEALQFAHDEGVVHRDIKPENILLDKKGRVKIADFGIAKIMGGRDASPRRPEDEERTAGPAVPTILTEADKIMGTPNYMAPEQVEHPQTVDHRADIYSLGVVFYEMLTGELPLGKFAPPSKKVQVDVRLDEVVLHALEKEPERRYQQASQMRTAVETIATAAPSRPPSASESADLESARAQVKGPATGLLIVGILNWLATPLFVLTFLFGSLKSAQDQAAVTNAAPSVWVSLALLPFAAICLVTAVLSTLMIVAALKMKRLRGYGLAITASILAIISPVCLVGLPLGIWALAVLSRREVREAFGKGYREPRLEPGQPGRSGGAWKVAAVIVAAGLLVLGIAVVVVASWRQQPPSLAQGQTSQQEPTFELQSAENAAPAGAEAAPRLQFRLVADGDDPSADTLPSRDGKEQFRLERDEAPVASATVTNAGQGATIMVTFTEAGAKRFAEISSANIGKRLAIVLDGKVICAPTIRDTVVGGQAQITGKFTAAEAEEIAQALRAMNARRRTEVKASKAALVTTNFYIGQSAFPHGDSIEITSVSRTQEKMVVQGHYNLISADRAQLALFITSTNRSSQTYTDQRQRTEIAKGGGGFELVHPHLYPGLPHVTMYTFDTNGAPFAGVYFGTKDEAAEERKLDPGFVGMVGLPAVDESFWELEAENLKKAPAVVIIRPSRYSADPQTAGSMGSPHGRIIAHNIDFVELLNQAYSFSRQRMILPASVPQGHFDLMLTLRDHPTEALQKAIQRQFGFTARRETRETDVLWLKVKDPTLLALHTSDSGSKMDFKSGKGIMAWTSFPIAFVANFLEWPFGKPVMVRPELSGKYDITFQWEDGQDMEQAVADELAQAGLELVPSREPIEMLVVEKAN